MASLKNSAKSGQRIHKERGQLSHRKHLGLLEKHKDYVLRARDYHRKEKHLKLLKKKASEKNPDEFYFRMIKEKTKDGVHKLDNSKEYTAEEIKLMKTQDLNYINMKKTVEAKKVEKLQKSLHLLDSVDRQPRSHIFFLDSKEQVRNFDAAKQLNTVPDLLPRCHNRLTIDSLEKAPIVSPSIDVQKCEKEKRNAYNELSQRMARAKQLEKVRQEMAIKKQLMGKGSKRKIKRDGQAKAVYKWKRQRQK